MTVIVINAAEALAAYRAGKEIDYRLDNDGAWIANPFSDAGNKVVSVVDMALGPLVRFRVRPPLCQTELLVRDFGRKGMDGDTYLKIAKMSVQRALQEVRIHLSENVVGTAFVDNIERKYCGTPELKAGLPAAVEVGQVWKKIGRYVKAGESGTVKRVTKPDEDGDVYVHFEGSMGGGWCLRRFHTADSNVKKWEAEEPRFEYASPAL